MHFYAEYFCLYVDNDERVKPLNLDLTEEWKYLSLKVHHICYFKYMLLTISLWNQGSRFMCVLYVL
jgi:hypothetical protein